MSKIESATRTVLAFSEAFNRHDFAGMMEFVSEDCRLEHNGPAPDGATYSGKEAVAQFWQGFFSTSPRAHIEIEEIFGLGFHCVMRWRYDWEAESGDRGYVRGVDIFKLKDGLICEHFSYVKG